MKKRNQNIIVLVAVLIVVAIFIGFFTETNPSFSPKIAHEAAVDETVACEFSLTAGSLEEYILANANVNEFNKDYPECTSSIDTIRAVQAESFKSLVKDTPVSKELRSGTKGDMNCDSVLSFADINPFVLALSGEQGYSQQYPNCNFINADINCDGVVSFADINPFVQCLGGNCPPCPNPDGGTCGDNAVDSKEECDGNNLNGKSLCSQFDSDYTSGTLSCYPANDQYGRGCTYNLEACNCASIKAKLRIFPQDGSSLDLDKTKDGTLTQYFGDNIVFDANPSCGSLDPDYPYWFEYGDGSTNYPDYVNPIAIHSFTSATLPKLYSSQLELYAAQGPPWTDTQVQTNAIRIISHLQAASKTIPAEYFPVGYALDSETLFSIGFGVPGACGSCPRTAAIAYTNISSMDNAFLETHWLVTKNLMKSSDLETFEAISSNNNHLFIVRYKMINYHVVESSIDVYNKDPNNFQMIGRIWSNSTFNSNNASMRSLALQGNILYVGIDGMAYNRSSIAVFNVANPANPIFIKNFSMTNSPDYTTLQMHLAVNGNSLIAQDRNHQIVFYDISDPLNPVERSRISGDLADKSGASDEMFYRAIFGNILLLPSTGKFLDISNIDSPIQVGTINFTLSGIYHRAWVSFDDEYLVVAGTNTGSNPAITLYDISNLSNIGYLGTAEFPDMYYMKSGLIYKDSSGKRYYLAGAMGQYGFRAIDLEPTV